MACRSGACRIRGSQPAMSAPASPTPNQQTGASMAFKDLFRDTPASTQMISTLNPAQQALQQQVVGQAGSAIQGLGQNGFSFAPIEKQAREQFHSQTIPSLAERFVGSGSGPRSSAFQGALGAAGAGLETNLAALGAEYGLRGQELKQNQLNQLLGYGLQPTQSQVYSPSKPAPYKSFLGNILGTALPAATNLGVNALLGLGGQAAGAGAGALAQGAGQAMTGGGTVMPPVSQSQAAELATLPNQGSFLASKGVDTAKLAGALGIAVPAAYGLGIVAYAHKMNEEGKREEALEAQKELEEYQAYVAKRSQDPNWGKLPDSWPKYQGQGFGPWLNTVMKQIAADREASQQEMGGQ